MTFLANKTARGRKSKSENSNFKHQIFWGVIKLLIVALVGVSVWYVTRIPFFTIADISVTGGETIVLEDVRTRLLDELNGTYFLIIPKRFSYLYPHEQMLALLEKIPRIHNIVVERSSRTTLSVSFDEYIPQALWCATDRAVPLCYFLTKDGYAFAEAPALVGGTLIRHSIEGLQEISEGPVIDSETLSAINAFRDRAENELGFRITSLTHTKDGDIHFMINGGGMIYIAKGKDFSETFENVKSVLASKEFKHIKPGNFNYIDARFSNKIFVKEVPDTIATSTEATPAELPE